MVKSITGLSVGKYVYFAANSKRIAGVFATELGNSNVTWRKSLM